MNGCGAHHDRHNDIESISSMEHMYLCYILCVCVCAHTLFEHRTKTAFSMHARVARSKTGNGERAPIIGNGRAKKKNQNRIHNHNAKRRTASRKNGKHTQNRHTAEASDKYARAIMPMPNRSGSLRLRSSCTGNGRKQMRSHALGCGLDLNRVQESPSSSERRAFDPSKLSRNVSWNCRLVVAIKFEFNTHTHTQFQ